MAATGMACQDRGGVDGETRGDVAATRPAARSSTCSTDVAHDAASESAADEPPARRGAAADDATHSVPSTSQPAVPEPLPAAAAPPLAPSATRSPPQRGILRAPPPPEHGALWMGKELVYTLNGRLAHQNVPLKVPMPGRMSHVFGGLLRRLGGGPTADAAPGARTRPRHVHFRIADLAHTYVISGTDAPSAEAATRMRVEDEAAARAERLASHIRTPRELQQLYRMCCRAREESPVPAVLLRLEQAAAWPSAPMRTLDLHGIALGMHAVALADMLSTPTGVEALLCEACYLGDAGISALVHALLASNGIRSLSVAKNTFRSDGWHALGELVAHARTLRHLDVSQNALSRAAVRALLAGCAESALETLRAEQCAVRGATLEALVLALRGGRVQHLSLRHNQMPGASAEALSALLFDYDDPQAVGEIESTLRRTARRPALYGSEAQSMVVMSLLQGEAHTRGDERCLAARREARDTLVARALAFQHAMREVPVTGQLLTLDVRSNQLQEGATLLACALRRNRTLRVLSVADNALEPAQLAQLADALQQNTTLETLDVSRNPCCGTDLAGIAALRVALAIHPRLRRVFLAGTHMTADGAIALAECLPDAEGLVHLDLTDNALGLVGALGLATGLRTNTSLRCVDMDVEDSDEFARAAQEIYHVCAQNTEAARQRDSRAHAPLAKSALAHALHARAGEAGAAADLKHEAARSDAPAEPPAESMADLPLAESATTRANGLLDEEGAVFRAASDLLPSDPAATDRSGDELRHELLEAAQSSIGATDDP